MPGGKIEWHPRLRVKKIYWQLNLPTKSLGDASKPDPSWYKLVGKTVVVTGTLDIRPNIQKKSGERRTEFHVNVKKIIAAKTKEIRSSNREQAP